MQLSNKLVNKQKHIHALLFLLPSLLGVSIFFIFPFTGTLYYSVTTGISDLHFVGLENFTDLLVNPVFQLAIKNTFSFLALGVPLLVGFALMIGILLDKIPKLSYRLAILSPLILPSATLVLGMDILLGNQSLLNVLLEKWNMSPVNMVDSQYTFAFVVGVYLVKNLGYMLILITSAIGSVSKEYREAFALDSISEIKYTTFVLLPTIKPMIFFVTILSVMNGLKISKEMQLMFGNYPPNSVYMIQNFMNNNFFKLNYQRLSTAAILVIIVITIFISFYLRHTAKEER